jgi:putative SOS response-associated peptidase YedK
MCGRYVAVSKVKTVEKRFNVKVNLPELPFNTNVSAGDVAPVITNRAPNEVQLFEFGFTPNWYKKKKTYIINARSEGDRNKENAIHYKGTMGIITKPFFGDAIRHKRCLVIADAFIEGPEVEKLSKPYCVYLKDKNRPFAFAGIWDEWVNEDTGEVSKTFAILTTVAHRITAAIGHHRSPVILEREDESKWLDPSTPLAEVCNLMQPYHPAKMNAYPISTEIKNPLNNGLELLEPIGERIDPEYDFTIEKKIDLEGMGETRARKRRKG